MTQDETPDAAGDPPALAAELAWSMDADPALLPVLDALYADTEDLGACADDVVALLQEVEMAPTMRALDLGCGKGAVARALATHFSADVVGVDGHAPFVAHAQAGWEATAAGRGHCRFEVDDLRTRVDAARDYDLVLLLALGDALGDPAATVAALRRCVRPGGLMLLDDAYLSAGVADDDPLREHYPDREASLAALCSQGDVLVAERVVDGPEARPRYVALVERLAGRAETLAAEHPGLAAALAEHVASQRAALDTLDGPIRGVLRVLRRTDDP